MTPGEFAAMLRLQEQIQREYVKFAPMVREAKDIAAREVASFAPMVREAVKLKRDLAMWHRQKEGTPTSGAERVSRFLPGPTLLQSFRRPRLEHHDKESQPKRRRIGF